MSGTRLFHTDVRPVHGMCFPSDILEHKAVGFQVPVFFKMLIQSFLAAAEEGHEVFGQIPAIEQDHAERQFVCNGGFHQFNRQVNFWWRKLLVQGLKLGVLQQNRVNFLMQPRPFLFPLGISWSGKCGIRTLPNGSLLHSADTDAGRPEPHRATHVMAGDGIVGERVGVVTMIVMAVNILKQTPHVFAQGIIQQPARIGLSSVVPISSVAGDNVTDGH